MCGWYSFMQGKEWWRRDMQLIFWRVAKNRPPFRKKFIMWNLFAILRNGPWGCTESTRSTTLLKTTFLANEWKPSQSKIIVTVLDLRSCYPPLISSSLALCFMQFFSSILLMPCMHILFNNKEVDGKYSVIWLRGMVGTQCGILCKIGLCYFLHPLCLLSFFLFGSSIMCIEYLLHVISMS